MTAIVSSEKLCSGCDVVKNLTEFHKNGAGRARLCKPCVSALNKRRRDKRITEHGIDAERERQRTVNARSRENPEVYARHQAATLANNLALRRLRENHREEYEHMVREERYAAGLPI